MDLTSRPGSGVVPEASLNGLSPRPQEYKTASLLRLGAAFLCRKPAGRDGSILTSLGIRITLLGTLLGLLAAGMGPRGVLAAEPEATCSLEPGRSVRHIQAAGLDRRVLVEAGPRVGVGSPLVIVWHGWGGRPESMMRIIDPERDWSEAIVVAPEGEPRRFPGLGFSSHPGWQTSEGEFDDRDLEFFDRLLEDLLETGCVDPKRVFSTGFSNGGFFSNLLACTRSQSIAAIAPVAGGLWAKTCDGSLPALVSHGTRDRVVAYTEGEKSFAHWVKQNGCETPPKIVSSGCVSAENCRFETVFCSFKGDHSWPGKGSSNIIEFLKRQ